MTRNQVQTHFITLGKFLSQFTAGGINKNNDIINNDLFFDKFSHQIDMAVHYNGWFTKEQILFSLDQWSKALTEEELNTWLKDYPLENTNAKTVAIIMAGNIPLVGFHDFISVLISGHKVLIKQSSNDQKLLPILVEYLNALDAEFKEFIRFTDTKLEDFDAVIATGSNNSARYFEYYFSKVPSIIRKNRNSVAVLTGSETNEELAALGEDIFRYYGLGCRNVSKLYVPQDYNFDKFYEAIFSWSEIINQAKYANNYDYNKAVYLMSEFKLLDNGFLMLKEDKSFGSPIATVFYEKYDDLESLKLQLDTQKDQLQCIVGNGIVKDEIPFGNTQTPKLWDYADNVDTISFLSNI